MQKLGDFIVKRRWWVLTVWVIAAVLIVSLSPKLASIESNDQSNFLPDTYESVQASEVAKKMSANDQAPTDIIVFTPTSGATLTEGQLQKIDEVVAGLSAQRMDRVESVTTSPEQIAPSLKAQLATVTYAGTADDTATIDAVKTVRSNLDKATDGTGIKAGVTGGVAIGYDTQGASERALAIVSIGTILLVFILPAIIFRSPLAGLLPVLAVGLVFTIASSLVATAGTIFDFEISQQLSILFTVVLFGIGTDYILFLLFRYRERLRSGDHSRKAVSFALSRAGEAILSAALVVLTSFIALFFAKFGIFSSLAPGLVICVAVMMLAALTLIPALVAILGDKIFWPSRPSTIAAEKPTISKKVGRLIARRPGLVGGSVALVLLVLGAFAFGFRADFSSFSEPPKNTPSAAAYDQLTAAFPAGALSPTQVYVDSNQPLTPEGLMPLRDKLAETEGVSLVSPAEVAPDGKVASLTVVLKNDPYSAEAINDIKGPIHTAAHSFDSDTQKVYVGGATAAIADVEAVTDRDLRVIFPIAAAFIFIILAVLLRSLVAPVFLLFCVSLGYAATLGLTVLIFQVLGGNSGIISFIPLFMYIFVVAIGTDYNILTITRLREEAREGHGPRKAADLTVEHSSATVVAAGLILAATFGSLLLGGIGFLTQMGASISIGVALAAFVIAPFLIPSIAALVGDRLWWPGHRPGKKK